VEIKVVGTAPLLIHPFIRDRFLWICHGVLTQPLR